MAAGAKWYAEGLRFSCTRCGHCCTGEPGLIWVTDAEVAALAARLGLDEAAFRARYTQRVWSNGEQRTTLRDRLAGKLGHACIFFQKGTGCTVYEQRPRQCRTWPFWRRILASPEAWAEEALACPGMNRGELHSAAEMDEVAADDGLV
jgi:hypothetical protein